MQLIGFLVRLLRRLKLVILRPFAVLCLLIASVALASDVTRTAGGSGIGLTPVATHWKALSPQSLANAQAAVQRTTHKVVWTGVIAPVLQVPSWILFGSLGACAAIMSRRRREVNIYAN
jgi:hypothetical protein